MSLRSLLLVAALSGCYGGGAYIVETPAPPSPRAEVVVYRPGFIWVGGHWARRGSHWRWSEGHYVRERPNHVYVQGRWERRGRNYVWIDGRWHARGRVTIRDQRY